MEIVRQKNVETRIVFPLVDADGDPVTSAGSLDSEIDTFADGSNPDGFADCTNEATEIGSTGLYYLTLTSTEMNNDYIVVQIKSSSAKTQVILIRTMVGDPLNAATTDDGTTINVASGIVEAQVKSIDNNAITANSIASDAITAAKIATGAIDADAIADNAIDAGAIASDAITAAKIANNAITAAKIATDAIDADALASDAIAEINATVDTALADYDAPTKAELDAAVANVSVDEIQASALADLFNTDSGTTYGSAVAGSPVKEIADNAGGSSLSLADIADAVWDEDITTHTDPDSAGEALQDAGAAGTPPTAGEIADAVWDEATAGHTTGGTFGEQVKTDVDAILADTNELQTDWANGGRLDNILDARASQTSVDTIDDFLDTEIAAILADTNELQTDWANGGRLDLLVDAILEDTGTTLQAEVDGIQADTEDIQSRLPAALTVDGNIKADALRISGSATAADNVEANIGNLDAPVSTVDTVVDAIKAKTDNLPSDPADASDISTLIDAIPTANENADALLDRSNGVETSITPRQALRLVLAASAGKLSGAATTTITIRNVGDSKNRITATVDEDGNRTAVTTDAT